MTAGGSTIARRQPLKAGAALLALLLLAGCPDPDGPIGPGKDTEQPSLQITTPTAGATLLTDSVTVEGTATDNEQVTRLTYTLNGGNEQEIGITAGKSVSFRFTLPVQNGAGSLTLNAHDAAQNRGTKLVSFTVDACIPTLAAAAATPTSELTVQSVPARLAQLRGLVRVPGTEQAARVYPERKENGEVSLVVPLHPAGAAGGDAELILSDGTSSCRPVPFRIAPLPPASGTSEQVIAGVAVDPATTPVVGGQGTFRLRVQAGEGEVCAVRFGADAAQAPTTPDAEPVLRFNPCLQPGTATEADISVSFATRADGIYHTAFEVTDGRGVQRWSPAVLVEVRKQASDDQTPPAFSGIKRISNGQEVTDGSTVTTAQVTLQGTVSDEGGVPALTYSLNGGTASAVPNVTLGTSVAFNFNVNLASGQNVITLTAHDNAGNQGSATIRLTYTPVATSCDLTSPFTRRWTGGNSTSWSDAGNWTPSGVPSQADRLMICANVPNQPTLAANTTIAAILVQAGATLTVSNQVTLSVAGSVEAEGPITGPGLVRSTADGVVRGTVGNLTISGGVLDLGSHHLMVTGNLEINNHGLRMTDEAALLQVLGNLTLNAGARDETKLTAGTIELSGNLLVYGGGYTPAGTHTMILGGSAPQTVHFYNGSQADWTRFQNVTIENTAGVTFVRGVYVAGTLEVDVGSKLVLAPFGTSHVQEMFYLRDHAALEINGTLTCSHPMSRAKTAVVSGTGSNYCYNRLLNQKAVIVRLTWQGESPYDQDAYLSGPRTNGGRFEVNKDNPSYTSATTVHAQYLFDDRIGFGPTHPDTEGLEIARIYPAAFPDAALQGADGVFRFSVHDFTNATRAGSPMLSQSKARVEVLHGFGETGTLLTAYDVPVGKAGNWWHVFEMRIDNIDPQNPKFTFTALEQVVDTGTPSDPQPPAPTLGKKWNDPSNFSYSQPDYGLYWFTSAQDGRKALGRDQKDAYYDPSRPTVIYVHGWQKDIHTEQKIPYDLRRESFLFAHKSEGFYQDIISEWVKAGWNVGIFYWDKFADEDETVAPHHAEAKIWSTIGYKGMRWRKPDGTFMEPFQFSPRKNAMELFYEAYTEALHYQDAGKEVRVVGHSLGNQMAVRMTRWLSDQVIAGTIGANLLPKRIALLDPYWSGGGKDYSPLNGASTGAMIRDFVQDLKNRHSIVFEQYQTSAINDLWMGDKNHELQSKTAFVRIHPDFVGLDVKQAHGEAIYWYFSSFKTGAFLCTESPVTFTHTPVPSAAMPTESLRSWMNSGSYDWLEQVWGKDARSTSNDCFARRK